MDDGGRQQTVGARRSGVLAADLSAANAYEAGLTVAGDVQCPVLLLLGAADKMTPIKGARKLQDTIADCRTTVLPGAGHMMMVEAPRETLKAIAGFLGAS